MKTLTIQEAKAQLQPLVQNFVESKLSEEDKVKFVNALSDFVTVKGATEAVVLKSALLHSVEI